MPASSNAVNKPLLIVLGVVVGLAALFFLVVNPRLAADDVAVEATSVVTPGDEVAAAAPAVPSVPSMPAASEPSEASTEDIAPEAFEIYSARDPFEQLVQIAPTGDPATGTQPAAATPSANVPATGETGPGSTAVGPGAPGAPGAQAPAGGDGASTLATVSLSAVTTGEGVPSAQVVVDGTTYEAREGDVVTDSLQLLALAESCGTFQLGTVQFSLCEGESIRP